MAEEERREGQGRKEEKEKDKMETGEKEKAVREMRSLEASPEGVKKKVERKKRPKIKISRKKWDEIKEKAREANQYYDQLLRLKAEFENYRKRMNREREEFARFATEDLISDLLTVIDNLENALSASEKTEDFRALHEGVEMTKKEALRILGQWGLEEVKALGEKFDPEKHEAVMHVDCDEEEDKIVEELRKGYTLKGKLIRPSMVKVARRSENG